VTGYAFWFRLLFAGPHDAVTPEVCREFSVIRGQTGVPLIRCPENWGMSCLSLDSVENARPPRRRRSRFEFAQPAVYYGARLGTPVKAKKLIIGAAAGLLSVLLLSSLVATSQTKPLPVPAPPNTLLVTRTCAVAWVSGPKRAQRYLANGIRDIWGTSQACNGSFNEREVLCRGRVQTIHAPNRCPRRI
jgi:hypothetical protein